MPFAAVVHLTEIAWPIAVFRADRCQVDELVAHVDDGAPHREVEDAAMERSASLDVVNLDRDAPSQGVAAQMMARLYRRQGRKQEGVHTETTEDTRRAAEKE
jgi:hypothetical protein